MNAKGDPNLSSRPTKLEQSFGRLFAFWAGVKVSAGSILELVMLTALHHYQVIRRIVGAVAVYVMNDFIRGQRPPQHLFSNYPMLIQIALAALADNAIAITCNVAALPIRVIRPIHPGPGILSTSNWGALQLLQAGRAKSLVAQGFVLLRRHIVFDAKMRRRYLHRAFQAAQFTLDCVSHVLYSFGLSIHQSSKEYNYGVT